MRPAACGVAWVTSQATAFGDNSVMNIMLAKPTFSPADLPALPDGDSYELVDGQPVEKKVRAPYPVR